jgi:hypothetical protein
MAAVPQLDGRTPGRAGESTDRDRRDQGAGVEVVPSSRATTTTVVVIEVHRGDTRAEAHGGAGGDGGVGDRLRRCDRSRGGG